MYSSGSRDGRTFTSPVAASRSLRPASTACSAWSASTLFAISDVSCIHLPSPAYMAGVNVFSNICPYHAALLSGSRACSTYGTRISSRIISIDVPKVHAPPTATFAPLPGSMISRPRPTRCT